MNHVTVNSLRLLSIFFILNCDLENRYPDAGEFCTPMREVPECVQMDFRNKTLQFSNPEKKIGLHMTTRVEYDFTEDKSKLQLDVLSEHRIRIRNINLLDSSIQSEEIYIRKKGPRVSLWARIKKAWANQN